MSSHTIEAFLYRVGNDPECARAFAADPDAVFDTTPLTAEERRQIREWDLHAILDAGVSPMLLMFGYTTANGGMHMRDEYIRILNSPRRTAIAAE